VGSPFQNVTQTALPQPRNPHGDSPVSATTTPDDLTLTESGAVILTATGGGIHVRFYAEGEALDTPSVGTGDVLIPADTPMTFMIQAGDKLSLAAVSTATVTVSYVRDQ